MNPDPLVSIVTPSYNQSRYLEDTIRSVFSQDYPALEYIIVDGGSSDGSQDIIHRYAGQLSAWISEPDLGQSDAINKGFALSRGEIMAWINSDDLYTPRAVSEAAAFLRDHPEVGMVYGDTDLIDEKGRKIGSFNARQTSYQRLMRGGVYIPQPAAFWRRSLWDQAGPLDLSFHFAMDYDLWVRFAKSSRIVYTPRLWAQFRIHGGGKTTLADERCWPEMRRVFRREGGGLISLFMGKYMLRKLLGPAWLWYKKIRLGIHIPGDHNG